MNRFSYIARVIGSFIRVATFPRDPRLGLFVDPFGTPDWRPLTTHEAAQLFHSSKLVIASRAKLVDWPDLFGQMGCVQAKMVKDREAYQQSLFVVEHRPGSWCLGFQAFCGPLDYGGVAYQILVGLTTSSPDLAVRCLDRAEPNKKWFQKEIFGVNHG